MSLKQEVINWLEDYAGDADERESALTDLLTHGCQSGMVGSLIYYSDTLAFYAEHKAEIQAMARELASDCGCSIQRLFGDNWDEEDPFCEGELNQNLLAWFGFEEAAREVAFELGIEV